MSVRWDSEQLTRQLALGEGSRVEFKQVEFSADKVTAPRRETIANELAAFGNTVGGTLVFGVTDAGEVQKLERTELDALDKFVVELCSDSIDPKLPILTQRLLMPGDAPVLIVEVEQSALVHKSPGGYRHRQGSANREFSPEALSRLFHRRGRSGLLGGDEVTIAGTGPGSLHKALSNRFLSSRVTEPEDRQFAKLGLIRDDDAGSVRMTLVGALLATERPDEYINGAVIEAVLYAGTVLGAAAQLDAATIRGPIDRQIADAVGFVRRNTRVAARKAPGRVEMPQFSPRAVFEAVVNAVVHRDYSMSNAKIRLFIFDDRLELYSPGALPNTLTLAGMHNRQATRNETLASVLHMLPVGDIHGAGDRQYFLEQRGEGIPVICQETRALTGHDPEYELLDGAELRLVIPAAKPSAPGIRGEVAVTAGGKPLAGATLLAIYPDKTCQQAHTDSFGRTAFEFHSQLPITLFCAAPGHQASVTRDWHPPASLSLQLETLANGGSAVFTEGKGHLPPLNGCLNPIMDRHDRMYLYATNIAVNRGEQQPVHFRLNQSVRLTDVGGFEWVVRFVEMVGASVLVEYELPPGAESTRVKPA